MKQTTTIWFIGLHCSGKTTISKELTAHMRKSVPVVLLDGDEVRKTISSDLGYSVEDRNKHMARVADIASLLNKNQVDVIACVASPTEQSREYAKKTVENIITVYTKCSVEECEKRDVKGHYKKARNKEEGFTEFLGISLPFEEPSDATITLDTENNSVEDCMNTLLTKLKKLNVIE